MMVGVMSIAASSRFVMRATGDDVACPKTSMPTITAIMQTS